MSKENDQPQVNGEEPADENRIASQHPGPTVVGIGASAGGLSALKVFFSQVSADSQLAFVIVMHLSPEYESHLPELIRANTALPIEQITQNTQLRAGHIYVIPPGRNLNTIDTHLRLSELEADRALRAPIDHFFRTLAATHDGNSIGVILTGTGSDGTLGIREINAKGGLTVVQDPNDCEYDGMPQSAIATGVIDLILPLQEIPDAVARYARVRPRLPHPDHDEPTDCVDEQAIQRVFALLRTRTGRDFSRYKRSTILRRITRRMQLQNVEVLDVYLDELRRDPNEINALADDLLITVTNFFRDPKVFERLEQHIIPELLKRKSARDDVRVWSVGCATGEEAYSLAMLMIEATSTMESPPNLQVFASDLHEQSLAKARDGFYPGDIESDVNPERLKRFFECESGGYRIRKEVRERVVFAPHNLLGDPPFSKLDLIVCRNVMIYLQRDVQRDVIDLFHYSLCPDGTLVLGTSETVDSSDLFRVDERKLSIYRRRNVPAPEPRLPVFPLSRPGRMPPQVMSAIAPLPEYRTLHYAIVDRCGPPSLLVSPDDKAVYLTEFAGRYLCVPGGEITQNVFKLVREELRLDLRAVVHDARKRASVQRSRALSITCDGASLQVILSAYPVLGGDHDGFVLLVFDELQQIYANSQLSVDFEHGDVQLADTKQQQHLDLATPIIAPAPARFIELEAELETSRHRMQVLVEEYETSREEMKASNEELQSTNEELRSTMEELETSKEELQSMNEELRTLNQENRHRLDELKQLSGDLQNLLKSTNVATLFLDRELRIVRFTPKIGELFNIRIADRGRSLGDFTSRLGYLNLLDDAEQVLKALIPISREVCDEQGRWYLSRVSPYRSTDDRIEGVVITFVDFSERKAAELELQQTKERLEVALEAAKMGVWELDVVSGMARTNTRHNQIFGREAGEVEWSLKSFREQLLPEDQPLLDEAIKTALRSGVLDVELRVRWADGSIHWVYDRGRVTYDNDGRPKAMSGVTLETTGHRRFEQRYRSLFNTVDEGFCLLKVLFDEQDKPVDIEYLDVNPAFSVQTGLTDVVGKRFSEVVPDLEDHWFETFGRVAKTGTPERFTQRAAQLDNSYFDVYAFRIDEPGDNHIAILFENVTKRINFEQSLQKEKQIAQDANQSRGDFLANMSHEIRTPMTAILGHTDLLVEHLAGTEHASSLETIRRNGGFLLEIINDILDLSKIDAGQMRINIEPVRLDVLVSDVTRLMSMRAEGQGLALEVEFVGKLPRIIQTDPLRLRQILLNLVGNAIKFTREGSIRIIIRHVADAADLVAAPCTSNETTGVVTARETLCQIQFEIIDTGIGITTEQIEQLFQPFVQADASHTRQYGGTGLGLTISRRLAQALGGDLTATSTPGEGSTFTVVIDCGHVEGNELETLEVVAAETAETSAADIRLNATIVVVDDRRDIRFLAQHFIERAGGTVVTADNGLEAVELIARRQQAGEPIDAVIMDMQMPVMDGYEAAKRLRDSGFTAPIIALTANAMISDREHCLQAGCTDHIAKPIDGANLIRMLAKLTGK
ncbi:chemotaxis protein CheB [Novipirellula sp.]|uniref:chemotaxis protein CheB n=1 Tax=Novipirellula sp. TaxID=2795430 RepID=UPI0035696E9E